MAKMKSPSNSLSSYGHAMQSEIIFSLDVQNSRTQLLGCGLSQQTVLNCLSESPYKPGIATERDELGNTHSHCSPKIYCNMLNVVYALAFTFHTQKDKMILTTFC